MSISRESGALTLLCLADLLSTIFCLHYREATEGNPIMAYYLAQGVAAFIFAKFLLSVPPLYLAEYARRHRPRLVRFSLRAALALYLLAYVGGVYQLNS